MHINTNGNQLYEHDRANSRNVNNSWYISTETYLYQYQMVLYLVVLLHILARSTVLRMKCGMVPSSHQVSQSSLRKA